MPTAVPGTVFAACVAALRGRLPAATVELLVPDFGGRAESLDAVLDARPDVLNHNVETVPRLYPAIRAGADYGRSLALLARAAARGGPLVKSGFMLGLGETDDQVHATMQRVRDAGVEILALGQYLRPTAEHLPVQRYVTPQEFARTIRADHEKWGPIIRKAGLKSG